MLQQFNRYKNNNLSDSQKQRAEYRTNLSNAYATNGILICLFDRFEYVVLARALLETKERSLVLEDHLCGLRIKINMTCRERDEVIKVSWMAVSLVNCLWSIDQLRGAIYAESTTMNSI